MLFVKNFLCGKNNRPVQVVNGIILEQKLSKPI